MLGDGELNKTRQPAYPTPAVVFTSRLFGCLEEPDLPMALVGEQVDVVPRRQEEVGNIRTLRVLVAVEDSHFPAHDTEDTAGKLGLVSTAVQPHVGTAGPRFRDNRTRNASSVNHASSPAKPNPKVPHMN